MKNDILYNQLCLEEERLSQALTKIKELKAIYNGSPNPVNPIQVKDKSIVRRKRQKGKDTIPDKILSALELITEGKTGDVAKAMVEQDTSLPFEKAKKDAAYHLSKLFNKGKINATGDKRKGYLYSIKKPG